MTIFSRSTLLSAIVALGTLHSNAMTTDVGAEFQDQALDPRVLAVFTLLHEKEVLITNPATRDQGAKEIMHLLIQHRQGGPCYTRETLENLLWQHSPGRYKLEFQIRMNEFLRNKKFAFDTLLPYADDLYAVCDPQNVNTLLMTLHQAIDTRNTDAIEQEVNRTIDFFKCIQEALLTYEAGTIYEPLTFPTYE